jgi:release factor glutamine methyltransferase
VETVATIIQQFKNALQHIYDEDEATNMALMTLEDILGKDRLYWMTNKQEGISLSEANNKKLQAIIIELLASKPIQYILGYTWFYDLKFNVNDNVLIPRPETEELVYWILKDIKHKHHQLSILDIGTGSGCIPVALAANIKEAKLYTADVSAKAIEMAKTNAASNKANVNFIEADILTKNGQLHIAETIKTKMDIIVSNPPYVRNSEKELMQANVLNFEPHLALFVDDTDALLFYKAIADFAIENLTTGGSLYFEINENKTNEMTQMLINKGFKDIILKQDLNGRDRMMRAGI